MNRPKADIAEVMFLTKVAVICGCQFELHQKGRHAYWITSSAATSSVCGNVRPGAFEPHCAKRAPDHGNIIGHLGLGFVRRYVRRYRRPCVFCFVQITATGCKSSASANAPIATPIIPGRNSASQQTVDPHSGQKRERSHRPASDVRTYVFSCSAIDVI